ncbi:MAG: hypothetical protein ACREJQ_02195 [bacterium]
MNDIRDPALRQTLEKLVADINREISGLGIRVSGLEENVDQAPYALNTPELLLTGSFQTMASTPIENVEPASLIRLTFGADARIASCATLTLGEAEIQLKRGATVIYGPVQTSVFCRTSVDSFTFLTKVVRDDGRQGSVTYLWEARRSTGTIDIHVKNRFLEIHEIKQ